MEPPLCEETKVILPLKLPSNILICGETNSGKSCWIEKLLKNKAVMLEPPPDRVLLLYKKIQAIYERWKDMFPFLEISEGIDENVLEGQKDTGQSTLLILDGKKTLCIAYFYLSYFKNLVFILRFDG